MTFVSHGKICYGPSQNRSLHTGDIISLGFRSECLQRAYLCQRGHAAAPQHEWECCPPSLFPCVSGWSVKRFTGDWAYTSPRDCGQRWERSRLDSSLVCIYVSHCVLLPVLAFLGTIHIISFKLLRWAAASGWGNLSKIYILLIWMNLIWWLRWENRICSSGEGNWGWLSIKRVHILSINWFQVPSFSWQRRLSNNTQRHLCTFGIRHCPQSSSCSLVTILTPTSWKMQFPWHAWSMLVHLE